MKRTIWVPEDLDADIIMIRDSVGGNTGGTMCDLMTVGRIVFPTVFKSRGDNLNETIVNLSRTYVGMNANHIKELAKVIQEY